jgi:hypothetical protein
MHVSNTSHRASHPNGSSPWTQAHVKALGEFVGESRWTLTPRPPSAPVDQLLPLRPATGGDEYPDKDEMLGLLLSAIDDDVHRFASAARDAINADFAARVAYARKHLPRHQLAAALRGFAEARKAAFALVSRNAALELAARKKAALAARRRTRQPATTKRYPSAGPRR